MLVENLHGNLVNKWVGDPGTIVSVGYLTQFVVVHLLHGDLVGLGVILDRNLGRHATHGSNFASIATKLADFPIMTE